MPGKTPHEAVTAFCDPIQLAVSCVAKGRVLLSEDARNPEGAHALATPAPLRLKSAHGYSLSIQLHYRIVEYLERGFRWRVNTTGYAHEILREETRILGFHWHPVGRSPVATPHLHLPKEAEKILPALSKVHVPTGRVCVEEIVRFLIEGELAAARRDDWAMVLDEGQRRHEEYRSWGGKGPSAGPQSTRGAV